MFYCAVSGKWGTCAEEKPSGTARKQADSLARKQVIYNDRVVPFNTLARDFVLKLTGKSSYGA